ncbi:MAG: transcriptional regulator, LuxR family [Acidobacteriaceae bacterium]|nr:transcriptional regulator, LuxR family [Acidobacteriaceae bacterium]
MLGYTESELHERTFLEITDEEDRTANQELVRELVEGVRQSFQIEKRYCRKDGTLVWVRNNVVVPGVNTEEPFWFGIVEDIIQHNRLQDELRSTLAPNTPEMAWTAPPGGRFDFISELSQDIGGISKEAIKSTLDEWTKGNNSLPSLFSGLPPMSLRDSRGNVVRFVGSYAYI